MKIKYRELHRVTSTAIVYLLPHQNSGSGGRDHEYLIVKRSLDKKAFPDRWTVPGGGLEVDDYVETPKTSHDAWYFAIENSLKREVKEEVGLEIGDLKYLCDLIFIRPDGIPVVVLSYFCKFKSGDVKLNEENVDYKWVTFEEAKNYDLISGILEEIEMVDRILKGEKINKEELKNKINNKK